MLSRLSLVFPAVKAGQTDEGLDHEWKWTIGRRIHFFGHDVFVIGCGMARFWLRRYSRNGFNAGFDPASVAVFLPGKKRLICSSIRTASFCPSVLCVYRI